MKNNIKKRKKNFEYGVGDVYDVEEILHSLFRPIFWCYEINCKEIFILLEMVTLVYVIFLVLAFAYMFMFIFNILKVFAGAIVKGCVENYGSVRYI